MLRVVLTSALSVLAVPSAFPADAVERRALITPLPQYPERALRERLEGDVQVCYFVDSNGQIHRPRVAATSHRWFNRAAIRAARGLLYEPAPPGASNSRTNLCSTFRFRLNSAPAAPQN